uniref:Uncharacterized protein n=1 Tax=Denticeps clupeoides TaxID=299321 RepID=A0AAY4ELM8_9TELE
MAVGLMAPFGGLVCGLFFLAFLGYTDSTTDSIPLDMKKDIETLRRTKDDQKLLLLEMLHIYFDMFSNMQEKAKDPDARKAACELRRHVDNLINGYYICNKHLRKMLQEIRAMGKQVSSTAHGAHSENCPLHLTHHPE